MIELREKINLKADVYDFIEELGTKNDIYIFGAGSLADTVSTKLNSLGIQCAGAFVDKKYYKSNTVINGITVYEWDSFVPDRDIVVVMAMSDMKRGLEIEKRNL